MSFLSHCRSNSPRSPHHHLPITGPRAPASYPLIFFSHHQMHQASSTAASFFQIQFSNQVWPQLTGLCSNKNLWIGQSGSGFHSFKLFCVLWLKPRSIFQKSTFCKRSRIFMPVSLNDFCDSSVFCPCPPPNALSYHFLGWPLWDSLPRFFRDERPSHFTQTRPLIKYHCPIFNSHVHPPPSRDALWAAIG